jgi:hypothetical protein
MSTQPAAPIVPESDGKKTSALARPITTTYDPQTQTLKDCLIDLHLSSLHALHIRAPRIESYDQSSSVRCPIHGRHTYAIFLASGVPAQYVCGHCWSQIAHGVQP